MTTFYKLVFDISYFYALAAYFIYFDSAYVLNPMNYSVLLAAILLATVAEKWERGRTGLTAVAVLLPAVVLFWEPTIYGLVVHLLPWVYFAVIILRRGYFIQYGAFRTTFQRMFIPFVFPVAFFYFDVHRGFDSLTEAIPYLVDFLASGVLLLQNLRHEEGSSDKKKFERFQIKQTIVFFFVCLAITLGRLAEIIGNFVYLWIIRPAAAVIMRVFWEIVRFFVNLIPERKGFKLDQDFIEHVDNIAKENPSYLGAMVQKEMMKQDWSKKSDYTLLLAAIGIIVAIVGFGILMGHKGKQRVAPVVEDEREELLEVEPPATKLKKRSLQPEIVVRFYYRSFMRKVDTKTRNVLRSDTTAEIAEKYEAPSKDKAEAVEELTGIYRKTRYSRTLVTRQDASRMKTLMKET